MPGATLFRRLLRSPPVRILVYGAAILGAILLMQLLGRSAGIGRVPIGKAMMLLLMASTAMPVYLILVQRLEQRPVTELAPTGAVGELLAGILLAAAFVYTRRLWLPIGVHLGWNFFKGGICGASDSGALQPALSASKFSGHTLLTGGTFGPEASVISSLVCGTCGLWLLLRANK